MPLKISEIYGGATPYLNTQRAEELALWGKTLAIVKVDIQQLKGKNKVVLTLSDGDLEYGLPLNRTNGYILAEAFGDDAETWVGKKITLRKTKRTYGKTLVDAIEVVPVVEGARKK